MKSEERCQLADEKTPGRASITLNADGAITAINIVDHPMYWYDGEWHPYPKGEGPTIVEDRKP